MYILIICGLEKDLQRLPDKNRDSSNNIGERLWHRKESQKGHLFGGL